MSNELSTKLQQLEIDPEFAKLSYESQIKVRNNISMKYLSTDQEFMMQRPEVKMQILNGLTYRQPIFEDPETVLRGPIADMLSRFEKGTASRTDYWIATGTAAQREILEGSVLLKGMIDLVGTGTMDLLQFMGIDAPDYAVYDRDNKKLAAYLNYTTDQDQQMGSLFSILKGGSRLVAEFADIGALYGSMVGSLEAPVGAAKWMQKGLIGLEKSPKMLSWAWKLGRAGIHSVAGGMVGIARENAKDILSGGFQDPDILKTVTNSAKYFGEYALGDALFFAIGGALKNFWTGAKVSFTGFKLAKELAKPEIKEIMQSFKQAIAMEHVDDVLFARLPKTVQDTINNLQAYAKTVNMVEKLQPENLFKTAAISNGFTAVQKGSKWNLVNLQDKSIKFSGTMDEAFDWLKGQVDDLLYKPAEVLSNPLSQVQVKQIVGGMVVDEDLSKSLASVIAPVGGKFTPEQVENFARAYLTGTGKEITTNLVGNEIKLVVDGSEIASINRYVNPATEKTAVSEIVGALKPYADEVDPVLGKQLIDNYTKNVKQQNLFTAGWIDYQIQGLEGKITPLDNGTLRLDFPNAEPKFYSDYQEIGQAILDDYLKPEMLATYLANYEGVRLGKSKDMFTVKRGSKLLWKGEDWHDFLALYPEMRPKIPKQLGPQFTIIDPSANRVRYDNMIATGNYQDVMNHLSEFTDYAAEQMKIKMPSGKGSIALNKLNEMFEVNLPELGHTQTFNTMQGVKDFLARSTDELSFLTDIAAIKGYRVGALGNQIALYNGSSKVIYTDSIDALKAALRKVETPTVLPELSGIDEALIQGMKHPDEIISGITGKIPDKPTDLTWLAGNWHKGTEGQFIRYVERGGDKWFLDNFRSTEKVRDFVNQTDMTLLKPIEDLLKDLPADKRIKLGMLLEAGDQADEYIKAFKFSDKEVETVAAMREMLGQSVNEGLFKHFNVDPRKFIDNYMPRLRKYVNTHDLAAYNNADIDKFLRDVFGGQVPGKLDVWFKHARVDDLATFARENDPLIWMSKYISMGNRERYLGPVIESSKVWLNKNKKNLDPEIWKRFGLYLSDVAGIPQSHTVKQVRTFSEKLYEFMKLKNPPSVSVVDRLMQMSYGATMAFRPKLPIRNAQQVWTLLGPRIGNDWVADAIRIIEKDNGTLYKLLQAKGVFRSQLPLFHGEQIFRKGDTTGKLIKKGLEWFKNSDDYTRAVAYLACDLRYEDAWKAWQSGALKNMDEFINRAGLWNLSKPDLDNALKFLNQNKPTVAKDMFADLMMKETMLGYRAGLEPLAYRGTLGKIFGQMGRYSVGYVQNIRNMLSRGNLRQKLMVAGRFMSNNLALFAAFGAVGIVDNSFWPGSPALFGGGPWWDIVNSAIKVFSSGYEGREARATFGVKEKDGIPYIDIESLGKSDIAKVLLPGSLEFNYLWKGMDYMINKGDFYKAILSFGSFQVK